MLEKITQSTFVKMTAAAIALSIAEPAYADDYPVYDGSPSKETFGKQWVTESPATKQTPITEPLAQQRAVYSLQATVNEDIITLTGEKTTYVDSLQDFLIIQTQEQTMYRPKCKALLGPGLGIAITGIAAMGVGMLVAIGGGISEDGEIAAVGGIALGAGIGLSMGSTFGIIGPCSKFKETDKSRTIELSRITETQKLSSTPYNMVSASNLPLTIYSDNFTINGAPSPYQGQTDSWGRGTATIQLQPTDPGFAFSQQGLADIAYAQQLQRAGYSSERFMPLLQQNATPVQYTVTIETKARNGENAKLDVLINGFTVSPTAMQSIIMGL